MHCQGWISYLMPLYLKKAYNQDPIFADTKVVLSLYNDLDDISFSEGMASRVPIESITADDVALIEKPDGINLAKLALLYSDGCITAPEGVNPELEKFIREHKVPTLASPAISEEETSYIEAYDRFYDQILA